MVTKVNATDPKIPTTGRLVSKTQYDSEKQVLERIFDNVNKKIPNTKVLVRKTDYNTEITEFESKLPGATGLVTTAALKALQILKIKYLILLIWLLKLL